VVLPGTMFVVEAQEWSRVPFFILYLEVFARLLKVAEELVRVDSTELLVRLTSVLVSEDVHQTATWTLFGGTFRVVSGMLLTTDR
jgi:hypothetical protein